ncbi:MAG: dihydropteroate synthase [Ignavibacterium sp.]|nr:MAG: dihydropteroate synthase [Ignavibacterium sp.]
MIAQIINLAPPEVFKYYMSKYSANDNRYSFGFYGLELRDLRSSEREILNEGLSEIGELFYQSKNQDSIFLLGSIRKFKAVANRLSNKSPAGISLKLFNTINFFESYELTNYTIKNKLFEFKNAYVMGVLNVTPDSFSDGGKYLEKKDAVKHALRLLDEGADIIDIGGESSRPGAENVDTETELDRIIPVVIDVLHERPDTIISVDTTKEEISRQALEAGAQIINDISGGTYEPQIMKRIAEHDATYIIMHMKGTPRDMQEHPSYENIVEEVYDFLYKQIKKATAEGIPNIFVDPGIGFGKRVDDNFNLLNRLDDFKSLSHPIVVGVSRKSFIRKTLGLNIEESDLPTSMMESYSLSKGARIIRTHNVKNGVMLRELFNRSNNVTVE